MNSKIKHRICELKSFFKNVDNELNRDFFIYSYLTSDETKFIFVYNKEDKRIDENDLKKFFKQLHYEFAKVLLNPLYKLNSPIVNPYFDSEVD